MGTLEAKKMINVQPSHGAGTRANPAWMAAAAHEAAMPDMIRRGLP